MPIRYPVEPRILSDHDRPILHAPRLHYKHDLKGPVYPDQMGFFRPRLRSSSPSRSSVLPWECFGPSPGPPELPPALEGLGGAAVLRGGYVDVLVCNQYLAQALMEYKIGEADPN